MPFKCLKRKEKKTVDKTESKKNAVLIPDIRIIILETKIHPTPVTAPTHIFIFFIERREIVSKLFTYYGVEKEFQPWYFQIRVTLQMDFTHVSERDNFIYP